MPRERYCVLRRQTRKMVFHVYKFMKKQAEEGLQFELKQVQKRTSTATGVHVNNGSKIITESNDPNMPSSSMAPIFRTPGKKRRGVKTVTGIDNFDASYIKRFVHNFHFTERQLLTLQLLLNKLKAEINFKGSRESLRKIL